MLGGVLFVLTTWVDDVIDADKANAVWLGSLLFIFFWLYFPLTCGALLVYDKVREIATTHEKKCYSECSLYYLLRILANIGSCLDHRTIAWATSQAFAAKDE